MSILQMRTLRHSKSVVDEGLDLRQTGSSACVPNHYARLLHKHSCGTTAVMYEDGRIIELIKEDRGQLSSGKNLVAGVTHLLLKSSSATCWVSHFTFCICKMGQLSLRS